MALVPRLSVPVVASSSDGLAKPHQLEARRLTTATRVRLHMSSNRMRCNADKVLWREQALVGGASFVVVELLVCSCPMPRTLVECRC